MNDAKHQTTAFGHRFDGPYITSPCIVCGMPGLECQRVQNLICAGTAVRQADTENRDALWRAVRDFS